MATLQDTINQGMGQIDTLAKLLLFPPTKEVPTASVFTEALAEVTEERNKQLKGKVKEQLQKAIDLARALEKARVEFQKAHTKGVKELAKQVAILQAIQSGREPAPESESKDGEPKTE